MCVWPLARTKLSTNSFFNWKLFVYFFTRFSPLRHSFIFFFFLYSDITFIATVIDVQFVFITFIWNALHFPFQTRTHLTLTRSIYFLSSPFLCACICALCNIRLGGWEIQLVRLSVEQLKTHIPALVQQLFRTKQKKEQKKKILNFQSRWEIKCNKVQHWQSFNKFIKSLRIS